MVNAGSLTTAMFATVLGLVLGAAGLLAMSEAGSFGEAGGYSYESSGPLGLWHEAGSSQGAEVNAAAIIGLIVAVVGAAAFLFGLRALFAAFQGTPA